MPGDTADTRRQAPVFLRQETFRGGVHDFLPKHLVPESAAILLQNVEFQVHGVVRRRGGIRTHQILQTFGAEAPLLLKSHVIRDHAPFTVAVYNSDSATSQVAIDSGGSGVLLMQAPHRFDERLDVVQILDRIYFTQPGQVPVFWAEGQTSLQQEQVTPGITLSTMPYVGTATYFQGQAWATGDLAKPDLIYFTSRLGTDGNGEANEQIFQWDQSFQAFRMVTGRVEAIIPFRNQALVCFTDRGIETLEPNCCNVLNPHRFTMAPNIGCVSKHTIAIAGQDIYFMDQEGQIRSLSQTELDENQGVTNRPLSLIINNVIARQNKKWLKRSRACFSKGVYWIAMPMGGYLRPNEMWGYSIRDQAWIGPYRFAYDEDDPDHLVPLTIGGLCSHRFDGDEERLYILFQDENGYVTTDIALEPDDFTDRGVTIPVRIESRGWAPDPHTRKTWVHIEHEFQFLHSGHDASVSMDVEVRIEEEGWTTVGTETFAPDAAPVPPSVVPFTPTPYHKQELRQSLTGLVLGKSLQSRLTIKDPDSSWQLFSQTVSGLFNNEEFA